MKKVQILITAVIAVMIGLLTGCSVEERATTSAQCGFVVGDGKNGRDAKVHGVVYPGQVVELDEKDGEIIEVFKSIPCNSRNFLINPPDSLDANGEEIGDYHTPMQGTTKQGTKVIVWMSMFWTPNQTESVMKNQFYPFCEKFDCFSSAKSVNNSSPGWNDMLGENVPGALNYSVGQVLPGFGDEVWKTNSSWDEIGAKISERFSGDFSTATGFGEDLFCGSGDTSGWSNPDKPGEGSFTCGNVRFRIDSITPVDKNKSALEETRILQEQQELANTSRRSAAEKLYGPQIAGQILGNLDLIKACKEMGTTCVISIGGDGSTIIAPRVKN